MIDPGNVVWFHDHAPDNPCTPNCYKHVDSPTAPSKPVRYFLRVRGMIQEVYPLTKPSRENQGRVQVEFSRSGQVLCVDYESLILDY